MPDETLTVTAFCRECDGSGLARARDENHDPYEHPRLECPVCEGTGYVTYTKKVEEE